MLFININPALVDRLISALCDTLLYSLLLGVALAAVAGLMVVFTRKATSALRYNLLIGALVLFTAGVCITFATKFSVTVNRTRVITTGGVNNHYVLVTDNTPNAVKTSLTDTLLAWLNNNHNTVVLVWFLIICVKGIQLATGLQGVYRLKNTHIIAVADEWQTKVADMSARLGIKQKIAMLESGLAKVPMVIGHLKPVILIPIGLLTALSIAEVEAILMHELAHIRRRDYLVNLLQSLVEILFFFNPAVLWVSQLIKTERENCCDDMALAQNANKTSYIMALVSAEEYQQTITPAYAMGFPGPQNHLLGRVKRIVNNRNHSLDGFGKTLLVVCLVAAGICFSAFAEKENIKRAVHAVVSVIKHPKLNLTERKKLDEQTHKLDDETAKLDSQIAALDSYNSELDSKEPGVPPAQSERSTVDTVFKPVPDTALLSKKAALSPLSAQLNPLSGNLGTIRTRLPINITVSDTVKVAAVAKPAISAKVAPLAVAAKPAPTPKLNPIKPTLKQPYVSVYFGSNNMYNPDTTGYNKNGKEYAASSKKYGEQREEAIADLMNDGLIKTRNDLSFKLSTHEFIVNYKKMPDDVFEKYKAKYVKPNHNGGDWTWMYNFDTSKHQETNTVIDNNKN